MKTSYELSGLRFVRRVVFFLGVWGGGVIRPLFLSSILLGWIQRVWKKFLFHEIHHNMQPSLFLIPTGHFGCVLKAERIANGERVALKLINASVSEVAAVIKSPF